MDLTLDLSYLEMLSDGDTDFIATILETFVEEMPKDIQGIQTAIKENDIVQIGKLAHKTKSSLQTLGFAALKQAAFDLEQGAKKDVNDTSLLAPAENFASHLEKAIGVVSEKLTSLA